MGGDVRRALPGSGLQGGDTEGVDPAVLLSILAIVVSPVAALAGVLITNRQSEKNAAATRADKMIADRLQREHDAAERRYEDQRDAALAFEEAVSKAARVMHGMRSELGRRTPLGVEEIGGAWFADLDQALARVSILAEPAVADRAKELHEQLLAYAYTGDPEKPLSKLQVDFRASAHAMLAVGKSVGARAKAIELG